MQKQAKSFASCICFSSTCSLCLVQVTAGNFDLLLRGKDNSRCTSKFTCGEFQSKFVCESHALLQTVADKVFYRPLVKLCPNIDNYFFFEKVGFLNNSIWYPQVQSCTILDYIIKIFQIDGVTNRQQIEKARG